MKKLVMLFVIGAMTLVVAQPVTVEMPVDPIQCDKVIQEFKGNLPADVQAEIEKRKQEAEAKKKKCEGLKKIDPAKAEEYLHQCYQEACAKRDAIIAQLPEEIKEKVQARLAEVEKKIEERCAELKEKMEGMEGRRDGGK